MPAPPPIYLSQTEEAFNQGRAPWDLDQSTGAQYQGAPRPGAPVPPPAAPEPPPPDDIRPLQFFEPIGPVVEYVIWKKRRVPVEFQLLDVWEERALMQDIEPIADSEKIIVERMLRLARSLISVDGVRVGFSPNPAENELEREEWVMRFPGPLLYELSKAYERAAAQPIIEFNKLSSDPKSAP